MLISQIDQTRIGEAIRRAEDQTSAEIVCVLARESSSYNFFPLFWATFVALLAPWPLIHFTLIAADRIFLIQILTFFAAIALFSIPPVRTALVPLRLRRAESHRKALEQFSLHRLVSAKSQNGVLIFVSLAERWARIIVDEEISEKIPAAHWQTAVDALLAANRAGNIGEGFINAIEICAAELAVKFPPSPAQTNQLPNKIYLI